MTKPPAMESLSPVSVTVRAPWSVTILSILTIFALSGISIVPLGERSRPDIGGQGGIALRRGEAGGSGLRILGDIDLDAGFYRPLKAARQRLGGAGESAEAGQP